MSTRSTCIAALLTVGLVVAGCSSGSEVQDAPAGGAPTGATTETTESTAPAEPMPSGAGALSGTAEQRGEEGDITFARAMIPHHEQSIEMAALALDPQHGATEQVRRLASQITATAKPEIAEMTGWLEQWGVADRETADPTEERTDGAETAGEVTQERAPDNEESAAAESGSAPSLGAHGDHLGVMSPESMERLGAAQGEQFDQLWLEMMIDHHAGAVRTAQDVLQTSSNADVRTLATQFAADGTSLIQKLRILLKDAAQR